MRRIAKAGVALLGAFALGVLQSGTAVADPTLEDDIGVFRGWDSDGSGPPAGSSCADAPGRVAEGCFTAYGDVIWVLDKEVDGYQTYVRWHNEIKDKNGAWVYHRQGMCNNQEGGGAWVSCNKDFYENGTENRLGGRGSRIAIEVCARDPIWEDPCYRYGWYYNIE
ncbi:hypothetical protein [Streptomyces sp. NPDC090445]|uniref:hypothetical protein n=1 Tax=Streptomyces sp. NPDC090445 TaxID=3365963 RepID=UPI00381D2A81